MQLRVIQDSNNLGIGEVVAQVGMKLANGYKIVKVHHKSIIAENHSYTDKLFPPISIYYTEAARWGFTCPALDDLLEQIAAIKKIFARGEGKFRQFSDNGYILPLCDLIEVAGYDFAKEVLANREAAVLELMNKSKQKEAVAETGIVG